MPFSEKDQSQIATRNEISPVLPWVYPSWIPKWCFALPWAHSPLRCQTKEFLGFPLVWMRIHPGDIWALPNFTPGKKPHSSRFTMGYKPHSTLNLPLNCPVFFWVCDGNFVQFNFGIIKIQKKNNIKKKKNKIKKIKKKRNLCSFKVSSHGFPPPGGRPRKPSAPAVPSPPALAQGLGFPIQGLFLEDLCQLHAIGAFHQITGFLQGKEQQICNIPGDHVSYFGQKKSRVSLHISVPCTLCSKSFRFQFKNLPVCLARVFIAAIHPMYWIELLYANNKEASQLEIGLRALTSGSGLTMKACLARVVWSMFERISLCVCAGYIGPKCWLICAGWKELVRRFGGCRMRKIWKCLPHI